MPLPLRRKTVPGWVPGGTLISGVLGQGGHFDDRAQGGLGEADRDLAEQIIAFAPENLMALDVQNNIQISRLSPAHSRFAVA